MDHRARSLAVFALSSTCLLGGCPGDDGTTMLGGSSGSATGSSGPGMDETGSAGTEGSAGSATSASSDGIDPTADPCPEEDTPMIVSSVEPIALMPGDTMVSFDLDFDREVTIEAGGFIVTGGASVTAPALPLTASTFGVTIEALDPSSAYVFTVDAGAVFDACSRTMASSVDIDLVGDCAGNLPPASISMEYHQLPPGTAMDAYEIAFDEVVTLEAGAIAVVGGSATIDSITPALPAASDTFTVALSGLGGITRLRVDAALVSDGCGVAPEQDLELWVCTVSEVQHGYTGGPQPWVVPACAQGMVDLQLDGAQGAGATGGGTGGLGGHASGTLIVTTGETLELNVGGQDGWNGGGAAGLGAPVPSGSGGGASDVRQGGSALTDRVIVAAGGGGGAAPPQGACSGGVGGSGGTGGGTDGSPGTAGTGCASQTGGPGGGGSPTTGGAGGTPSSSCTLMPAPGEAGALGQGGSGSNATDCSGSGFTGGGGAGGGGGYYGGGGGAGGPGSDSGSWGGGGGGGGSSYTGGVSGGATNAGTNAGDGQVTVSW